MFAPIFISCPSALVLLELSFTSFSAGCNMNPTHLLVLTAMFVIVKGIVQRGVNLFELS